MPDKGLSDLSHDARRQNQDTPPIEAWEDGQKLAPTRTKPVARLLMAVPVSEAYSDVGRPNYPGNWGKAG